MHTPLPDDTTQARWLVGVNADTSEIPAYSLVKVTATDTQGRFDVAEPDASDNVIYVVGDLAIPAADDDGDGVGAITGDWPAWAAYDPDDGEPAIGETWGHEAGTFLLKKDLPGFRVVSDPDTDQEIVRVERTSAEDDADCCGWSADAWTRHEGDDGSTTYPTWQNMVFGVVPETEMAFDSTGFTKFVIHGTIHVDVLFLGGVPPTTTHPIDVSIDAALAIVDSSGNYLGLVTTFVPVIRGQIFNAQNVSAVNVVHCTGDVRRLPTGTQVFGGAAFEGQASVYFYYSTSAIATLGLASTYERTAWFLRGGTSTNGHLSYVPTGCQIRVMGLGTGGTWLAMDRICCETDALDPISSSPPLSPPPPPNTLAPVASFTHSPQSGDPVLTVGFVDTSSNTPTSWSWNFGDGNTSNEQHPVNRYSDYGTYTVVLTACNAYGCSRAEGIVTVTQPRIGTGQFKARIATSPPPIAYPLKAGFLVEPVDEGYAPFTARFHNSTHGGRAPIRYTFDFGDGTGTQAFPGEHVYQSVGSYTATLTAIDAAGRESFARRAIIVTMPAGAGDGSLTASFGAAPPFVTPPYTATFTDTSSSTGDPITTWEWTFGDGATSSLPNPTHDYPGPGTYHVTLTVSHATDSDTAESDIVIP